MSVLLQKDSDVHQYQVMQDICLPRQRLYTCNMQVAAHQLYNNNNIGWPSTDHIFAHQPTTSRCPAYPADQRLSGRSLKRTNVPRLRTTALLLDMPISGSHSPRSGLLDASTTRPSNLLPSPTTIEYSVLARKPQMRILKKASNLMHDVDSKEYWNDPDRPDFIKVSTPYTIVSHAAANAFLSY